MKLTENKEILQFVQDLVQEAQSSQLRNIAFWAIQLAYARGQQWRRAQTTTTGTVTNRYLKEVINPDRKDVRVSLNLIEGDITKADSRLTANEIPFDVLPSNSAASTARVSSAVGEEYLRQQALHLALLPKYQWCSFMRTILGSHLLKLVFRTGKDGNRWYDIAAIDPWQITLDPTNRSPDIANCHEFVMHTYAAPADLIAEQYKIDLKPLATMGQLMQAEEMLSRVAQLERPHAGRYQSKRKGILIHELCTASRPGVYDQLAIIGCGLGDKTQRIDRKVLWAGPNPFAGLPFMKLDMFWRDSSPWSKGVPGRSISAQDIFNLSLTNMVRYLVHASWVRWLVPRESMHRDQIKKLQGNVMNNVIEYSAALSGNLKPELARPPDLPTMANNFVASVPAMARRQIGLEDVGYGVTSK